MGLKRTCERYQKVNTNRGVFELRCAKFKKKKGKAICAKGMKSPARSPGLIHEAKCKRR